MSLNKITNSAVRKEWMNINCKDIKCETLNADDLTVDEIEVQQLTINSELTPQLTVKNEVASGTSEVVISGSIASLLYKSDVGAAVGSIISNSIDNTFKINPESRETVQIDGVLQLERQTDPPVAPNTSHLSMFANVNPVGNFDVFTKDSENVVRKLAAYDSGSDALDITFISGGVSFNQVHLSRYSVCGDKVNIWGVFRLDANAKTVEVEISEVPGYPVLPDSYHGTILNGHKSGAGGNSFLGIDTTYSAGVFQLLYGVVNDATVVPANNLNVIFTYNISYLLGP